MVDKDDTPSRPPPRRMAEMAELANTTHRCFRESLVTYLVGDTQPRKSWAVRILDWVFGEKLDTSNPKDVATTVLRASHQTLPRAESSFECGERHSARRGAGRRRRGGPGSPRFANVAR